MTGKKHMTRISKGEGSGSPFCFTHKVAGGWVKVYFNDILYFMFDTRAYEGIQAWVEVPGFYCIEIYLGERTMVLNYDEFKKWKGVLEILDKIDH